MGVPIITFHVLVEGKLLLISVVSYCVDVGCQFGYPWGVFLCYSAQSPITIAELNSLAPGDTIWCTRHWWALVQLIVCVMTLIHKWCLPVVNVILVHQCQGNFVQGGLLISSTEYVWEFKIWYCDPISQGPMSSFACYIMPWLLNTELHIHIKSGQH